MGTQYRCNNEGRRQAVASQEIPEINGIDYLEVEVDGGAGKSTLKVHFILNLDIKGKDLTKKNIVIEGGVRVKNVEVEDVSPDLLDSEKKTLNVIVNTLGDFSTYTLRITQSKVDLFPPEGFDPQLSSVDFSFKVGCPSEFDCKPERECPPENFPEPEIDYLAKDYASFRRLMLDRLSVIMPDWKERNPADLQIALVEMLAYVGDSLSYYQDAVATEAYLGTARKRISVRRHVRMLDYFMHDGCNARAWVCLEIDKLTNNVLLPEKTLLLTRGSGDSAMVDPDTLKEVLTGDITVFETMDAATLYSANNCIKFYTWNDTECCLPRGSTHATLLDRDGLLSLNPGDVLVFEEVCSPTTGKKEDANPSHRYAIRLTENGVIKTNDPLDKTPVVEIEWYEEDALPFPLCISALIKDSSGTQVIDVSIARGNVVLVDHGRTLTEVLNPELVPEVGLYRPKLSKGPLTYKEPFNPETYLKKPASFAMQREIRKARPAIDLLSEDKDGEETKWSPQYDLLASDRFSAEFVVENELDGISYLRFGENVSGKKPDEGSTFKAIYRIGNGRAGNLGAEALSRVVMPGGGVTRVRNPLPASGGTEPENIEQVRLYAPQAFRTQERAVTEADYAEIALRHPGVQKAMATIRWTGSWYTVFVTIDRKGGRAVDSDFEKDLLDFFEKYRMAGYDLEINGPIYIPLEIAMDVCVKPGYFRSDVEQSLLLTFSSQELGNGKLGFFHPDNFTFGEPLYLSLIYEAAMRVAGVASVEVTLFRRWSKATAGELEKGVLIPGTLEILRLDNDPNFPENGKISFKMEGGL